MAELEALREERLQLHRRFGLELGEGTGLRRLVGPPTLKAHPMTEAPILESIERDLADELGTDRFPGQVAVLRPATGPAGRAPPFEPRPPAERLQHPDQFATLRVIEAGGMAVYSSVFPL